MNVLEKINFYKFNKNIGVVEIFIEDEFKTIKNRLDEFIIEDKTLPRDSWQVLYMEQYFSADRKTKICDTYDKPKNDTKDFYLIFFIYYLEEGQILYTPFGNVKVTELKELNSEYKGKLQFEDID